MILRLKGTIRNGRVEVDEPINLPEGTEVIVATETPGRDEGPVPPEEIAYDLAAMRRLLPLDISDANAAELDAWEKKLNQHGIDNAEMGIEDVFR